MLGVCDGCSLGLVDNEGVSVAVGDWLGSIEIEGLKESLGCSLGV